MTTLLFNKPYGVLSQFTPEGDHQTLAEYGPFPRDVYPVGRLDADTEGLLLLTNDANLLHRLTEPKFGHERTYWAHVERVPSDQALAQLASGVIIGGHRTRPANVRRLSEEPPLSARRVPIRFRKNVPTSWIELRLTEGKNRQVRRMTAAVGHPTLRLVRVGILFLTLEGLRPGEWRELTATEVRRLEDVVGRPGRRLT
ncbi:MAG: pseudouridine synthase [Bacteroidetes bacterium]|jgi:23S rRNA pseudouridine2457 synthase|nr:pseudouridine synthase [Bacteroidota bacterium]